MSGTYRIRYSNAPAAIRNLAGGDPNLSYWYYVIIVWSILLMVYFYGFGIISRGHTVGKYLMGIKVIDAKEKENISLCTMDSFRKGAFDIDSVLDNLPDKVFITVDVDCFDWSVIRSTGTPEPGGFLWDEALVLLEKIFQKKNIVAFDIVELSYSPNDFNSPFAAAKLIYKMLGFKFKNRLEI